MRSATVFTQPGCGPCRAVIRDVVPRLEAAGLDVEVVDLHDRPCHARAFGIDAAPTIIAHDGRGHRIRCRGYPCEEAIRAMCADTYKSALRRNAIGEQAFICKGIEQRPVASLPDPEIQLNRRFPSGAAPD